MVPFIITQNVQRFIFIVHSCCWLIAVLKIYSSRYATKPTHLLYQLFLCVGLFLARVATITGDQVLRNAYETLNAAFTSNNTQPNYTAVADAVIARSVHSDECCVTLDHGPPPPCECPVPGATGLWSGHYQFAVLISPTSILPHGARYSPTVRLL